VKKVLSKSAMEIHNLKACNPTKSKVEIPEIVLQTIESTNFAKPTPPISQHNGFKQCLSFGQSTFNKDTNSNLTDAEKFAKLFDPENPPCIDEETMHKLKNEFNDWDYGIIFIRWFGDVLNCLCMYQVVRSDANLENYCIHHKVKDAYLQTHVELVNIEEFRKLLSNKKAYCDLCMRPLFIMAPEDGCIIFREPISSN
jgi:hypothetical protein